MLQVNNLSKSFGGQTLFTNASFNFPAKAKVGLIGRNGSGKSTLLKIITKDETYDTGEILTPKSYHIGALKQYFDYKHPTLKEECESIFDDEYGDQFYKIEKILFGLGFTKEDLAKDPYSFSGGFQLRLNLAKVLLISPELLILDEPTNYLDILSLRWLKFFIQKYPGEVLIVTHDRAFLDSVITHTLGIHRGQVRLIKGQSTKYFEQVFLEEEVHEKARENQLQKKKQLEEFITKYKAKASKATQAKSKEKQLAKMQNFEELQNVQDLSFQFNLRPCPSKFLLTAQNLTFGFSPDKPLFEQLSFAIQNGDHIGIVGANGKGKSTLLNCLAGELNFTIGDIHQSEHLSIAHFGQTNINRLHLSNTIIEEISNENHKLGQTIVRNIAASMMFAGELAEKKVSVLSGGEKSRVMLGKIIAKPANLLLLDEPTNHLDFESIQSLTTAIKEFKGASLFVTHSEDFLRQLATKLIYFQNGTAKIFDGSYDEFLAKIGWHEGPDNNSSQPSQPSTTKEKLQESPSAKLTKREIQKQRSEIIAERSKAIGPLKKSIEALEKIIMKSEAELKVINEKLVVAAEESIKDDIIAFSKEVSVLENTIEESFLSLAEQQEIYDEKSLEFESRLKNI